ncbi:MAG: hypothetical protein WBA12_11885 [Catalinimonas sp.]
MVPSGAPPPCCRRPDAPPPHPTCHPSIWKRPPWPTCSRRQRYFASFRSGAFYALQAQLMPDWARWKDRLERLPA